MDPGGAYLQQAAASAPKVPPIDADAFLARAAANAGGSSVAATNPDDIPGMPKPTAKAPEPDAPWYQKALGTAEAGASAVSGMVAQPLAAIGAGISGITETAQGRDPHFQDMYDAITKRLTYIPQTDQGKSQLQALGSALDAAKIPPVMPELATPEIAGPAAMAARQLKQNISVVASDGLQDLAASDNNIPIANAEPIPGAKYGSVGASGTSALAQVQAEGSPALQAAVAKAAQNGPINPDVVARNLDFDKLGMTPVGEGQVTRDPSTWANDWNTRTDTAAERAAQKTALANQVIAAEDRVRPNLATSDSEEDGAQAIKALQAYGAPKIAAAKAASQAVLDANQGVSPIDANAMAQQIHAKLTEQGLINEPGIQDQLQVIMNDAQRGGMGMDKYLSIYRNLGMKQQAGGTTAAAAGVMRDAMQDMPLTDQAAGNVRDLANTARGLWKSHFDEMKADPAYDYAMSEANPDPSKFTKKYVIQATPTQVGLLKQKLDAAPASAEAPYPQEILPAVGMRYLKDGTVLEGPQGETQFKAPQTFANKLNALSVGGKDQMLFDPDTLDHLQTIKNVSHYINNPPEGAVVNNSGTATVIRQFLQQHGANTLESGLNAKAYASGVPFPVGTAVRKGGALLGKAFSGPPDKYPGLNYVPPSASK